VLEERGRSGGGGRGGTGLRWIRAAVDMGGRCGGGVAGYQSVCPHP
jgi:hypothetical protein